MKCGLFSKLGFVLATFTIVTLLNSCEVDHFYETEITVVNAYGEPKPGFTVTTTVDVDADYEPYREGVTNDMGKVSFSYNNIAILKVQADSIVEGGNDYHGEALIVLEEDKIVPITVVVY